MRTCIRCVTEMLEDHSIGISTVMAGVANVRLFSKSSVFSGKDLGKVKVAVCPTCGYIEMYTNQLQQINKTEN